MKVSGKVFFDAILVVIFSVMVAMSFGYNSDARLVPLVVGIPSLLLSLIQFLADGISGLRRMLSFTQQRGVSAGSGYLHGSAQGSENEPGGPSAIGKKAEIRRAVRVFAWLALLTLSLGLFNYLICVPAFILLFMLVEARVNFLTSLLVTAGTEGFIFLLFGLLLNTAF